MRKLLTFFALLLFLFLPFHVQAQGEIQLSSVTVSIWPEYDQPAVLMIYRIAMAPGTTLPASLTVRIPGNAKINAVATNDPTSGLVNAPYEESVQGDWDVLKITANTLQVQVECYAPLVKNGAKRHIVFGWVSDTSTDKLEVNFLRPLGATGVTISQTPVSTSPGQDSLMNYQIQAANLAAGKVFTITIDYERTTDALSNSGQAVQAASTPGSDTPGRASLQAFLPWVLAGIGVLLIAGGIIGFFAWQRGGQGAVKARRHVPARKESEDENIYCHECGKRAQPGDVFCRTCGTRLRRG